MLTTSVRHYLHEINPPSNVNILWCPHGYRGRNSAVSFLSKISVAGNIMDIIFAASELSNGSLQSIVDKTLMSIFKVSNKTITSFNSRYYLGLYETPSAKYNHSPRDLLYRICAKKVVAGGTPMVETLSLKFKAEQSSPLSPGPVCKL
jgi:hypothetical protein